MSKAIEKKEVIKENIIVCTLCEEKISEGEACLFQNDYYCLDCLNEISSVCIYCGERISEEEVYVFNDACYCQDCLDEISFICEHCGARYENEENEGDSNIDICRCCYDNYYTRCVECERVINYEDACYMNDYNDDEPYCQSCYEMESSIRYIHDYSYKPDPIFRGNGRRYFGVELEVDEGGKNDDNACEILGVANRDCENVYIKTDGSLHDGFEIVTHPMTIEYHMENMPWEDICDMALRLSYRSHNTTTSGLHIHINRTAFGETVKEQEEHIARILYFFENNWCELLRFSRRTNAQLNQWAKRYGWKEEPMDILDDAKNHCGGRYSCINITNYSTIEIRIFRGTLKYNTIIATLQLVNAICDVAVFMSDFEIRNLGWSKFVLELDTQKYKELIRYLKERRLYVNEPVNDTEEMEEE